MGFVLEMEALCYLEGFDRGRATGARLLIASYFPPNCWSVIGRWLKIAETIQLTLIPPRPVFSLRDPINIEYAK
jgi:hypothetical protein